MISAWIADFSKKETEYLYRCTKKAVGMNSDEMLEISICPPVKQLAEKLSTGDQADLACIDVTKEEALSLTESFRGSNEQAYLVLIADVKTSPVTYMKPTIRAESLILKSFSKSEVMQRVTEAVLHVLERFEKPDTDEVFVLETAADRRLIPRASISYFESRDKKISVVCGARSYSFYDTMDRLEKEMGDAFIRCHRSYLVNKEMIDEIQKSQNLILLTDGSVIPISRSCRPVVMELR